MRNNGASVGECVCIRAGVVFCSLRLLPVVGPVTYSVCVCVCVVERDREQQLEWRRGGGR